MPNDLSINKIRFKSTVLIKSWSDTIENTTSIISSHFELQSLPKVGAFLIQKNMYIAALSPGHYMIISDHQDLYLKLSKILSSENAAVIDNTIHVIPDIGDRACKDMLSVKRYDLRKNEYESSLLE